MNKIQHSGFFFFLLLFCLFRSVMGSFRNTYNDIWYCVKNYNIYLSFGNYMHQYLVFKSYSPPASPIFFLQPISPTAPSLLHMFFLFFLCLHIIILFILLLILLLQASFSLSLFSQSPSLVGFTHMHMDVGHLLWDTLLKKTDSALLMAINYL